MSSVFFLALLLFQLELALFFGFLLFTRLLFSLCFIFFILLLKRLLRLSTYTGFFKLFMHVSLTAFWVIRLLLDLCFDGRAESQVIEMFKDKGVDLRIGRLRAEYNLTYRELFAVQILKYAYPERLVKVNRQLCFS